MIYKLIPFALMIGLAACTAPTSPQRTAAATQVTASPPLTADSDVSFTASSTMNKNNACDAQSLQSLLGQKATPDVIEAARKRSNSVIARLLRPGQVVTLEYHPLRLNLIVDEQDLLIAIRCG